MADQVEKVQVGTTLEYDFSDNVQELDEFIREQDATGSAVFLPSVQGKSSQAALRQINKWVTKPVIAQEDGTVFQGKTFKKGQVVRGPIAPSLGQYVSESADNSKVKWETVLDSATGDLDRKLNGEVFDANDPSNPLPPLHPNCRCQMVSVVAVPNKKAHNQAFLR